MRSVFTVLLFGLYEVASATILDSFQPIDHSNDLTFGGAFEGGHSFVGSYLANCVGGERDVEFSQFENTALPGPLFMTRYEEFRGPYFRVGGIGNNTPGNCSSGHVIMQYDGTGDEQGNTGRDFHLNNGGSGVSLFNPEDGGIRIWYRQLASTELVRTTVTLRRLGSTLASQTKGLGGFGADVHFDSFAFSPDIFGIADSMTIDFFCNVVGGGSDQTLELDHIDTILPEPSSFAAFGLGGMMLGLRYRRRRNA